jgi:hypothetical protein
MNSDPAGQHQLDIWKWSERIDDVAISTWLDRPSRAHPAQADPAIRHPVVGVQLRWLRTIGDRDCGAYVWQSLSDTKNHMLFTKYQTWRTHEAAQFYVPSQYENASTAEGQPAGSTVGKYAGPLNSLPEQAPNIGQHNVLVPRILERQKIGRTA